MTLPLRKKRPTIAPNTQCRTIATELPTTSAKRLARVVWRYALWSTVFVAPAILTVDSASAQTSWSPERINSASQAKPLAATADAGWLEKAPTGSAQSAPGETQQLGTAALLRWKTLDRQDDASVPSATQPFNAVSQQAITPVSAAEAFRSTSREPSAQAVARPRQETRNASTQATAAAPRARVSAQQVVQSSNPLRNSVQPAAYQQELLQDPFGQDSAPAAQDPSLNNAIPLPRQGDLPLPPTGLLPENLQPDPLQEPELAPPPTNQVAPSPFDSPTNPLQDESPRDQATEDADEPSIADDLQQDGLSDIKRRRDNASMYTCDDMRERLRSFSITDINLDVSPDYGVGLRATDTETVERRREQFAEDSQPRQWRDYRGRDVAFGRLVDLRDDRVILNVAGTERAIPLRDLSDVDVAYVGDAWHIPAKCGTGYEPFEGRNFVASTVQWTASGLCHKPLYFEQVQLERYGHEIGPALQPLVSSAHFFGSIGVLPYKAGIHPPNECQYALGYYRPGDCAPYMMQPIPWSLRGGLTQAAAVTGAAALIP